MPSNKRSKVDCEKRLFNNEWYVIQHNKNGTCLICQNTIAVMKEQWWPYKRGGMCKKNKEINFQVFCSYNRVIYKKGYHF